MRKKIELQESSETGFMKYRRFGIPLLSNLSGFYINANVEIKQKLLGSIFPAKLHFREGSYRTTLFNPALAFILEKNKVLENEKPDKSSLKRVCPVECPSADGFRTFLEFDWRKIEIPINLALIEKAC